MQKLKLLFLEDDEWDIYLIRKVIERSGIDFDMMVVSNESQFTSAIREQTFDAILADNSLPHFSGNEALHYIKTQGINKPFILVTGTISEDLAVNIMKEGACDYILKDRLQRLPSAITSSINKYLLEGERKKILNEKIAKEAMMNEGERLAHFGSWEIDLLTGAVHWSDEQFRILGYEPGEVSPSLQYFYKHIHPEDLEWVTAILSAESAQMPRQNYECRIICKRGTTKHIYAELAITRDDNGQVIRMNGFMCNVTQRKEAELKLIESERKYRHLFDNNPQPMWVMEPVHLNILDVNKAAIREYGYTREEFLSMTTLDVRPEEEKERYLNRETSTNNGYTKRGIWKHLKKDGTIIQVEISTDDIYFEGRKVTLVLINDVTEKLIAEEKLKRNEEQLKASQRIAHIGGWEMQIEGNNPGELLWSDETYRIFGFTPGEVIPSGELFYSMVPEEDHAKIKYATEKAFEHNEEYIFEHRVICKGGETKIVHEIGTIIRDPQRKPIRIEGTIQDVTTRRKDEELLQKSEANLRTICNTTDTGYVLLYHDLRIIFFNEPANKFAQEQLIKNLHVGECVLSYFSDGKKEGINKCLLDAISGNDSSYEVCYVQANGCDKWYHASYHPVSDNEKKVLGVLMAISDITERKLSELRQQRITDDLLQRNKDLEQFAYIISHNLRAPVANIMAISNALLEGNLDESDTAQFMDGLNTSIHKLDAVIVDLNNILQVKHKINEHKEKVCLTQVVKDIKFSVSNFTGDDIVMIMSDFTEVDEMLTLKSYIYSIFHNLISNSIKYRQAGLAPVIEIKSYKTQDKIGIVFKDNSMGIDLLKKGDQVFGLYKRFHHDAADGKGMGLFMVKTQVETLGGKISIKSKVNEGTEFKIEFSDLELLN